VAALTGLGRQQATPDRPIVAITGDGGFGQYLGELNTAVKYGIPITHILLNNAQLGKISKEQRAAEWDVWQTSLHNPNFSEYARVCDAHGVRVTNASQPDDALAAAFAHERPYLVEVMTDAELV
jgi:thiamine pyrophosphate-dependent acetolactate synthase large subunit-like protein